MKLMWELTINAVEVLIIYDFLVRYFGYRLEGFIRYAGTLFFSGMSFAVISALSYVVPFESASTILMVVLNFMFCACLLKGSVFEKAFISAFVMAAVAMIAVGTAFVFSIVRGTEVFLIFAVLDPVRMIAMASTKVILFIFTRLILYLRQKTELSLQEFLLLEIIPLFSVISAAVMMPVAFGGGNVQERVCLAIFIIIVMNLAIYYLFLRVSRANRLKQDYSLLEFQYLSEQKRMEDAKQMYQEIRSLRHDIKNHLLCIDLLAEQEKHGEIRNYIHELSEQSKELNRTLLFTGNDILDAILNTKISAAERKGIHCTTEISCTQFPMTQSDMSVLLGNLLDNAIEAAVLAEDKRVDVKIARQGSYLLIMVRNTIVSSVLRENPELETSKKEKSVHGFGIRNIRKIVDKYNGLLEHGEEENLFICSILLPDSANLVRKTTNHA